MSAPRRTALVLLASASLVGAEGVRGQPTMTVLAGVASSTFVGTGTEALGNRTGIYVGAWVEVPLFGPVSFAPGGHYIAKGFAEGNQTLKLNWFEAAPLLRVAVPFGLFDASVVAGPSFAAAFGCTHVVVEENVERLINCQNADFGIGSGDIGALVGGGLSVQVTPLARFTVNVFLDAGLISIDNPDLKSRSWIFSGGVSFRPGR